MIRIKNKNSFNICDNNHNCYLYTENGKIRWRMVIFINLFSRDLGAGHDNGASIPHFLCYVKETLFK